jgi:nucleoside-diphosphate-sugar epimerase
MDPVLTRYSDALGEAAWLGYLSSTGVYGDCGGAWVDETAPVAGMGGTGRRTARALADAAWLDLGARVLRLPGIYGPGRSAFDRLRSGRAHRVDMPNQIFSRIHVEDIASATLAALAAPPARIISPTTSPPPKRRHRGSLPDQRPPLPPMLDQSDVPPASRAFYAENRRVANGKARRVLGWRPMFSDYRAGLRAIWDQGQR